MRFDQKVYGARIKKLRITKGLTQEQLAEKVSVSRTSIVKIENGTQSGSIELAVELAEFFVFLWATFSWAESGRRKIESTKCKELLHSCLRWKKNFENVRIWVSNVRNGSCYIGLCGATI